MANEEILSFIHDTIVERKLTAYKLDEAESQQIQNAAQEKFVEGHPRSWWMSLKQPYTIISSSKQTLMEILPEKDGLCWFIPETEQSRLPVYNISIKHIELLIADCPFFEYYVLNINIAWLVIESDHNEYFLCK